MKKIILCLGVVALTSTFFSSCSKDDDKDNNYSYQVSDKKLVSAVCGNRTYTFEYDASGRVVKESSVYQSSSEKVVSESDMSYNGNSFTVTTKDKENDEEYNTVLKGTLNANGYISEFTEIDDEGEETISKFSYKDGFLSSVETVSTWINEDGEKESYGEKETWTWKDGDLMSYTEEFDDENPEVYIYIYSSELFENKGYLSFIYPWVEAVPSSTANRVLSGLAGKHLPNAIHRESNGSIYKDELKWEFDADGYPVSVSVVGSVYDEDKITFVWK